MDTVQGEVRIDCDQERADVQGVALLGGDPAFVDLDQRLDRFYEVFCGHFGHAHTDGGIDHSLAVFVRAEQSYLAVCASVGL